MVSIIWIIWAVLNLNADWCAKITFMTQSATVSSFASQTLVDHIGMYLVFVWHHISTDLIAMQIHLFYLRPTEGRKIPLNACGKYHVIFDHDLTQNCSGNESGPLDSLSWEACYVTCRRLFSIVTYLKVSLHWCASAKQFNDCLISSDDCINYSYFGHALAEIWCVYSIKKTIKFCVPNPANISLNWFSIVVIFWYDLQSANSGLV